MTVCLEIINIAALVPQLRQSVLNISEEPSLPKGSYEQALWINALITLSKGNHKREVKLMSSGLEQDVVSRVINFINSLVNLKQKVNEKVYNNELIDLEVIGQHKSHYHYLDI